MLRESKEDMQPEVGSRERDQPAVVDRPSSLNIDITVCVCVCAYVRIVCQRVSDHVSVREGVREREHACFSVPNRLHTYTLIYIYTDIHEDIHKICRHIFIRYIA